MKEELKHYMTDIHMHIVPGFDDGSEDMDMSLEMLSIAEEQGIRSIFCTSHSWCSTRACEAYSTRFQALKDCARERFPSIKLYTGCELLCYENNIEENIAMLNSGILLPLGDTRYVLTELFTDTTSKEAELVAEKLLASGWIPIFAHMERYPELFHDKTIEGLLTMGCMIQVNAYSLAEETNNAVKRSARELLLKKQIHFLGSDAHQTTHRPPRVKEGMKYIWENTEEEYAEAIFYKNVEKYLMTNEISHYKSL